MRSANHHPLLKALVYVLLVAAVFAGCTPAQTPDPTESSTQPARLSGVALLEALNAELTNMTDEQTPLDILQQMGYTKYDLDAFEKDHQVVYHPSTRQYLLLDLTKANAPAVEFPQGMTWEDVGDIMNLNMKQLEKTKLLYKIYACIGDSTSYGAGSSSGDKSWCDIIANKMGAQLYKAAGNSQSVWEHLRLQIEAIPESTDLVTVLMGVNDNGYVHLGKFQVGDAATVLAMENDKPEDYESSDLYNHSFIGRFRWCLEALQRKVPGARIIVVTPLPYNNEYVTAQIVAAEKALCQEMGIEVIVPTDSPIFEVSAFNKLQIDGLHPNDEGYQVVADFVYAYIAGESDQ